MKTERVVVGISGASGAALGVRILERLAALPDIETHLVVSNAAWRTLALECAPDKLERLPSLVHHRHPVGDVGASIATGRTDTLLTRAADVQLKERRRLVLLARETPLHLGHLRSMVAATEMGAIIMPPVPAFYHCPSSVAEIVDHLAARAIDLLALSQPPLPKAGRAERSVAEVIRGTFRAPGRPSDEDHHGHIANRDQDKPGDQHWHQAAAVDFPAADLLTGKHQGFARFFLVHDSLSSLR